MSDKTKGVEPGSTPDAKRQADFATRLLRSLGSVKFALVILLVLTAACILGTILPQNDEVVKYLEKHPSAESRMEFYDAMGLTHVFQALWFRVILLLLGLSLSVCTMRRVTSAARSSRKLPPRLMGSMITHVSILLILAGAVVRSRWGEKGYLTLREGTSHGAFYSTVIEGKETVVLTNQLPFVVELVDFEIEYYDEDDSAHSHDQKDFLLVKWNLTEDVQQYPANAGAVHDIKPPPGPLTSAPYRVEVVKYIPDFVIDMSTREVTSRSNDPNNPAVQVVVSSSATSVTNWLFARYPQFNMHGEGASDLPFEMLFRSLHGVDSLRDGPIKDWKSHLRIHKEGEIVAEKTIEVNDPLRHEGYSFFQSGYRGTQYSTLQVARDPGVPVVYAGFILMTVGLFISFCAVPAAANSKKKAGDEEKNTDDA